MPSSPRSKSALTPPKNEYRPLRHSGSRAKSHADSPLIVWGLGSGSHLLSPLRSGRKIYVFAIERPTEPSEKLIHELTTLPEFADAFDRNQLELFTGDASSMAQNFSRIEAEKPEIHVHLAALDLVPDSHRPLALALERLHSEYRRPDFVGQRMRDNLASNIEALVSSPGTDVLRGAARGLPVFILAAGPSLSAALPHLDAMKKRGIVLAADTSFRPCLSHAVVPDLVCSVDPNPESFEHFGEDGLSALEHSILAFQPYACPRVISDAPHRVVALPEGDRYSSAIAESLKLPTLPTVGTVLLFAYQLAIEMEAKSTIFVGADFAFVGGFSHAPETAHAVRRKDSGFTALDSQGYPVSTSAELTRFRRELESAIAQQSIPTLSIDGGGAAIEGTRSIKLPELLAQLTQPAPNQVSRLLPPWVTRSRAPLEWRLHLAQSERRALE